MAVPERIYIASYARCGGVHTAQLAPDGRLTPLSFREADRVLSLAACGSRLLAALERPDPRHVGSALQDYIVDEQGTLQPQGEPRATGGEAACQVTIDRGRRRVYCAHDGSGDVSLLTPEAMRLVAHRGRGPDSRRQNAPHIRQVTATPDGQYVCAVDLGTDTITVYDPDLCFVGQVSLPGGCGPRNLVFSADGRYAYCVNELRPSITVLAYGDGVLRVLHSVALPGAEPGSARRCFPSAVRISGDGEWLLVANRAEDALHCFRIRGDRLMGEQMAACGGRWPRDVRWAQWGRYVLVANEKSDEVAVLPFDEGRIGPPVCRWTVVSPVAICTVDEEQAGERE